MSRRGGARRTVTAPVSGEALRGVLEQHVRHLGAKAALHFGAYEHIGRAQAIYAPGIRANQQLLRALLELSPTCTLKASSVKQCLVVLASTYPELNRSQLGLDLWSGERADKVGIMLHHLRRYKSDANRQRQAASKSTEEDLASVESLADLIDLAEPPAFQSSSSCSALSASASRELKREVSLDSDGYPNMLGDSPAARGPPAQKLRATDLEALSVCDELMAAALAELGCGSASSTAGVSPPASRQCPGPPAQPGVARLAPPTRKRPSPPSEKGAVEASPPSRKRPAPRIQEGPAPRPQPDKGAFHCAAWGRLFVTAASGQSYIQYICPESSKKQLLVSLSAKSFPQHREDVLRLAAWISEQGGSLTKEGVLARRDDLHL